MMWKLLLLAHLYIIMNGNCQIIEAPMNLALMVGQRLDMVCQPETGFVVRAWLYQTPFNTTDRKIYANWSTPRIQNEHFDFDTDGHSINIYINSTEEEDAGTYNCYVQLESRQPLTYSAQMIVIVTELFCEDNITTGYNDTLEEGSIVWIRCSFNYRGNLAPSMEWRLNGESGDIDGRVIAETVDNTINPDSNISSTLTLVVSSTYNASFITCRTYFEWDNSTNPNSTVATNSPDYSYTWNSSVVIVQRTTFVQEETSTTVSDVTTSSKNEPESSTFNAFNSIYLVAGVAVLFGVASSLVAIILCLRLRRKNSAALADIDQSEPFQSPYDLIPYAITDGYDTIEEVNENDDILFMNFPPRHGPLPSPGYSALTADELKPPGVYSRMDHKDKPAEEGEIDIDGKKLDPDSLRSNLGQSKLSYVEGSDKNTRVDVHSYLDLTAEKTEENPTEGEELPSAYLTTTDDCLQFKNDSNLAQTNHNKFPNSYLELLPNNVKDTEIEKQEMPSAYLTCRITDDSLQSSSGNKANEYSQLDAKHKETLESNSYLGLIPNRDKQIVSDNEDIPSVYLTTTEKPFQSITRKAQETSPEEEIPSSYLTTREIDSSAT